MKIREIKVSYSLPKDSTIKIHHSKDLYDIVLNNWNKDTIELQEEIKAVFLNRANHVIGIYELSKGGISSSIVDIKLLMSVALKCIASNIVLVHNHPSGNLKPSSADIKITEKVKQACQLLEISFLDHLIISRNAYYSFCDEGNL